jgi:hypothetical protein
VPNQWIKYSAVIPGCTTGVWATGNGCYVNAGITFGAGSSYTTTQTNQWNGGSYFGKTGMSSIFSTVVQYFGITQFQIEKGSVATDFERRSYAQELALCQRYYEKIGGSAYGFPNICGWMNSAKSIYQNYTYGTPKRATPQITINGTWLTVNIASWSTALGGISGFCIYAIASADGQLYVFPDSADDTIEIKAEY